MPEQQSSAQVPVYFDGKNVYYYPANNNNNSDNSNRVNVESDMSSPSGTNNNNVSIIYVSSILPAVSTVNPVLTTLDGNPVNGHPLFTYMYNRADPFHSPVLTTNDNTEHEVRVAAATPQEFNLSKDITHKESNNSNNDKNNNNNTTTVVHILHSGSNSTSDASHSNSFQQTSANATCAPQHTLPVASYYDINTLQPLPQTNPTTNNVMY